jgi:serine/threonine protein phosphatase PrpC
LKLDIAMLSKAGGRSTNEDACGYWTSDDAGCWVLSDGAGGHGAGDVAARSVAATVLREFASGPQATPQAVARLILQANVELLEAQRQASAQRDMRATVAILALDRCSQRASWGHLGDSRVYGFRGGRLRFQSRDHSVVQDLVDAGLAEAAMLRHHPQRSVLLAALGSAGDLYPQLSPEAEPVRDGDVYMLCSDGLWEYVEEAEMETALFDSHSAQDWLAALEGIVLARAERGHDNYSAIAVWIGDTAETTRIAART